jgi:hypothetical protein
VIVSAVGWVSRLTDHGGNHLTQEEFIVHLFCCVDNAMTDVEKDPRSHLGPSELVTVGLLFVLRGQSQRHFYLWLKNSFVHLFPRLPERSRLFRLLARYRSWAECFLAKPSLINIGDSLGIELVHPRRERRTPKQIGTKGISNGRWIVGVKFCPLLNGAGRIVDWDAEGANVHDSEFQRMLKDHPEEGKMTDRGFHRSRKRGADCANLLIRDRGQSNFRMIIETVFSNWVRLWGMKKITERNWNGIEARLAFACAAWNLVTDMATKLFGDGTTASLSTAWVPI